jgi:hypothetical protein
MAVEEKPLDEVLLAMDVVDTLRHRAQLVDRELGSEERRADLLGRLRQIYKAQGIEVPDHILLDGVKALEERRFAYNPPKASLSVKLARLYVSRRKWGKPVISGLAAISLTFIGYQGLVAGPQKARVAANELALTQTLPNELGTLASEVAELSITEQGDRLVEAYLEAGQEALRDKDADAARAALAGLETLREDLSVTYDVRVRYRNNAESGFSRTPPNRPGQRNYYLVVEAVDPRGNVLTVPISSEEVSDSKRTKIWAQRVSKSVFDQTVADKRDDTIIQNDLIGEKLRGKLVPDYTVATRGGALLTW